jgi:hypothetical protein
VHFVRNRVELALAIQNHLCVCVPHDIFDKQEKVHIRATPKPVQDPGDRTRFLEVTMGLIKANPAGMSSGKDIFEIPAWLRKQMD